MREERKNLFANFISLGALQIISYIIPLISLPYLSRILGVEYFGIVFFAFATMQYFIILTDYGFGLSATRQIAVNRHNQNNLSNVFNSVMVIKFMLLIISFIILLLLIVFIPKLKLYKAVFILSFFMVVGSAIYPVWFFQGMERMKYITFLNILSKLIFLILIFTFVKQPSNYLIVPLFNSLGFMTAGLIGVYFAVKELGIKLYIPKWLSIIKQFKYSSEFFLSRVAVSIYTNTNTFCLGLIGSNVMVGYYVAAEKIYTALNGLQLPLNHALYPYVSKYRDVKLFKKIFLITIIINTFICLFVFLFAKYIITVFYGKEMLEAYKVLRIFCLGTLVAIPDMLLGYPLLGGLGYTQKANLSVIISAMIHLLGLFFLYCTNKMNIYSIASMAVITESVVLLLRSFWVVKYKLLSKGGIAND